MCAVVFDQPTCPAAAPHVAASAIHPYPLSAHVPEVTMGYTVVCRPASLLHELLELSQKSPVVAASQSVVPLPSEHTVAWLQVLKEDEQTSPVADVQIKPPEAPQKHGAGLAVAPSPWAQAGPVKAHRQALEME